MKAYVTVTLKPSVLDPQGQAIEAALAQLGFDAVGSVRQGRFFEIKLQEEDPAHAERAVADMCQKLLANPVIETYKIDME